MTQESMTITGLPELIKRLKSLYPNLGRGCERGLKKGGLLILRESMKEVPVDTGNLRASGFCRKVYGSGFDAGIQVGYTAAYAVYVHENLDALHGRAYNQKYASEIAAGKKRIRKLKGEEKAEAKKKLTHKLRGENQKAKFLEDPMRSNIDEVFNIISREVAAEMKRVKE